MEHFCRAPFSAIMARKHCVLIAIAVISSLMPVGVFSDPMLRHKFEKRYSSKHGLDLPLQGTDSRLIKRWTNNEPNKQLILAKLEREQESDSDNKKPSAAAPITFLDNGDDIYYFEKKQTACMQDSRFFMNSETYNSTQDLKGEEHNREPRACPYNKRAYESIDAHTARTPYYGDGQTISTGRRSFRRRNRPKLHRSSQSESTNQKLLDYLIKTVRDEQSKEREARSKRSAKYQKIDKRENPMSNLFDERKNLFKRSIEVPDKKMYEENREKTRSGRYFHQDLSRIFKRSVGSDNLNAHGEKDGSFKSVGECSSLHADYGRQKRSANFGDVTAINDPGCNCIENDESAVRGKRSTRLSIDEEMHGTEYGSMALDTCCNFNHDNRNFAKRSTVQESVARMTDFENTSKRSIARAQNFQYKIISAVKKCCDLNPAVAEIFKESRLLLHRNENDISRSHGTDRSNADKHRIQKRRVNLVMNDPTFEELGLNPVQVKNCVNEMLEVPGFTEQGLDWQILGDHFRHYFAKMKDLTESYGLGLFAAIRELTNFHRWMRSGRIQGPYMSGYFTPYYYQRRAQKGQPSVFGYQEKPVYGRTGPYSNFPEYVPPQATVNKQKTNDYDDDYPVYYMDEYSEY